MKIVFTNILFLLLGFIAYTKAQDKYWNYDGTIYNGYAPTTIALKLDLFEDGTRIESGELVLIHENGVNDLNGNQQLAGYTSAVSENSPGNVFVPGQGVIKRWTVGGQYVTGIANSELQTLKYTPDGGNTIYTLQTGINVQSQNGDLFTIDLTDPSVTVETTATTAAPTTAAPTTAAPTTAAPTTQAPCENGQYRDEESGTCQDCPAGYRGTNEQGDQSTACTPCSGGEFSDAGAIECSKCPIGTAGSGVGDEDTVCQDCKSNGEYSDEEGLEQCKSCTGNNYLQENENGNNVDCLPCAAGSEGNSPVTSECNNCQANFYSEEGESCTGCPAGTQGDPDHDHTSGGATGSESDYCKKCEEHHYNNAIGSECSVCPAGTDQEEVGQTGCNCCPVGEASESGGVCGPCDGDNAVSLFGECLEPDSDSKEDKEAFVKEILNKSKTGDTTNDHDFCRKEGFGKRKRQRDLMKSIKQILRQLRDEGVTTKVKKGEILMTDKVINKMGEKSDIEVIYAVEKGENPSCDDKDVNLYDQPDTYDVSTDGISPLLICADDEPIMKMKVTTEGTETAGGVYSVSCYEDNGWNSYDSYNEGDEISCLGTIFYANSAAGLTCTVNQTTPSNGGEGNCTMETLGEGQECEITCADDTYRAVNGKCKQVGDTVEYVPGYCEARALGTDCDPEWDFDQNRCDALLATYNDKKCCGDNEECQGLQKEFQCRQCCEQPPVVLNYQLDSVARVEACRGETVIVNFLDRLNIQEMLGEACDSGDIGEPIVGFHNQLEQRTFIAIGAESGDSRYFRSTEGCSADGGKFILTCNVNNN